MAKNNRSNQSRMWIIALGVGLALIGILYFSQRSELSDIKNQINSTTVVDFPTTPKESTSRVFTNQSGGYQLVMPQDWVLVSLAGQPASTTNITNVINTEEPFSRDSQVWIRVNSRITEAVDNLSQDCRPIELDEDNLLHSWSNKFLEFQGYRYQTLKKSEKVTDPGQAQAFDQHVDSIATFANGRCIDVSVLTTDRDDYDLMQFLADSFNFL